MKPLRLKVGIFDQLLVIAGIFLLSFITFDILFKATGSDGYFQEIIAALIGTILAAVVTAMLLTSQSRGEELKERNVEVFRKKFNSYDEFLTLAVEHLADWELDEIEIRCLRASIYRMSLFSSNDTMFAVSSFLRSKVVQDIEFDLSSVVAAFRAELALTGLDSTFDIDLDVIDRFLISDSDGGVAQTRSIIGSFRSSLLRDIALQSPEICKEFSADEPDGVGEGLMFTLNAPRSISYMISIDYPDDDEIAPGVEVILDATELPKREVEKLFKIAEPLGFSREDEDEPYATLEIARLDQRDVPRIGGAGWDTARVARAILELHSFLGSPAKKI